MLCGVLSVPLWYRLAFRNGSGAVVMTNGENGLALVDEILTATAEMYDWPALQPVEKSYVPLSPAEYSDYVGSYQVQGAEGFEVQVKAGEQGLTIASPYSMEA